MYSKLTIIAQDGTEIWLGDDQGHFVQKEITKMETSLIPGIYYVQFGLKATRKYPVLVPKFGEAIYDHSKSKPTFIKPPDPKEFPEFERDILSYWSKWIRKKKNFWA